MAGIIYTVSTGEQALSAAPTTAVQATAAANQRLKIHGFSVGFNGTSATAEPVAVRLLRQSTAGTMSAGAARVINGAAETPQATVTIVSTTNPTAGDVLFETLVHPQGGFNILFPPELMPQVPAGGRVGIELTAPATVDARTTMIIEE